MEKRDLYHELVEGFTALAEHHEGKKTLKTHRLAAKAEVVLAPEELRTIRENLQLSQAVFAQYLQTGLTTYQNWEQGRAKPNKQAILLIRLIENESTTLEILAKLA
ncbi:helix-turn-helix domain-containing protein [Erwinia rhapontici]|uniref:Transcriptional regulator n=1 Tax=Erwinia rhapontici TaxID=55212 RepID=A0ABN6DPE4_ERWRD|nr:type II toxin-antitoxin system MqsA family antitoxin [Erwinia rhapontici]MCS3608012.1 putative transcriptional regulator [Erwinia rhapontici]TDT00472.1 putative transcriptional regulator [Erwinia rhapontici]BCQ36552.1 transcriptional regulator [Erwinia rhapontici]BCQ41549.1 transcriptional regulator [Erwinia rhapontici]BCQ46848.1 transcriptional regulator [Erwinia rhapontici]